MSKFFAKRANRSPPVSAQGDPASISSGSASLTGPGVSEAVSGASIYPAIRQFPHLLLDGYFDLPKKQPKRRGHRYVLAVVRSDFATPRLRCDFYWPSAAPPGYHPDPTISLNVGYKMPASTEQTQGSAAVITAARKLSIQDDCPALFYISARIDNHNQIENLDISDLYLEAYQVMVRIDKSTSGSTRCYLEGLGTSFRHHEIGLAHALAQHTNAASRYRAIPTESTAEYRHSPLEQQLELAFRGTSVRSIGRMPVEGGDWNYLPVVGCGAYEALLLVDSRHCCSRLREFRPYGNRLFASLVNAAGMDMNLYGPRLHRMMNRIPTKVDSRRGSGVSSTASSRRGSEATA